jgi:hypothetical protein
MKIAKYFKTKKYFSWGGAHVHKDHEVLCKAASPFRNNKINAI